MSDLTFVAIESAIVESNQLTANEKTFYMVLKSFRNRQSGLCFPSMRRVVERCGMSKNTVYKCRKHLQQLGIIEHSCERGRKHRNQYRFILEDCQEQDIERVLSFLKTKKIYQNRDIENSTNEGQGSVPILGKKISQNKDAHSNQKNTTTRNTTHRLDVCESSPVRKKDMPEEIRQYIDMKVESKGDVRDVAAYRACLVRLYQRGELDTSDLHDLIAEESDPWGLGPKQEPMKEEPIDLTSKAHYLAELFFEFCHEPFGSEESMLDLLKKHDAKDVETVLKYCITNGIFYKAECPVCDLSYALIYESLLQRKDIQEHLEICEIFGS